MKKLFKLILIFIVITFFSLNSIRYVYYKDLNITGKIEVYIEGCETVGGWKYCQLEFIYLREIKKGIEADEKFYHMEFLSSTYSTDSEFQQRVLLVFDILLEYSKISEKEFDEICLGLEFPDYLKKEIKIKRDRHC